MRLFILTCQNGNGIVSKSTQENLTREVVPQNIGLETQALKCGPCHPDAPIWTLAKLMSICVFVLAAS